MADDFIKDEDGNVDFLEAPSGIPTEVSGFSIKQQQLESPFGEGDKQDAKENKSLTGKLLPPGWPRITPDAEYVHRFDGYRPGLDAPIDHFSFHLQQGERQLLYLAVEHTNNPANPQSAALERHFSELKPDVVLYEGPTSDSPIPDRDTAIRYGEKALTIYLAQQYNKALEPEEQPVIMESTDIPDDMWIEEFRKRGYSNEQIAVLDILRKTHGVGENIRRNTSLTGEQKTRALEEDEKIRTNFEAFMAEKGFPNLFPLLPKSDGHAWDTQTVQEEVKRLTGQDLNLGLNPLTIPELKKMFDDESIFRDEYIVKKIAETTKQHDRVMIVMGSGHALREEAALREYFDAPPDDEASTDKEKMKPTVLYHASSNRNIEILEPRAETVRDENEGPVVFASSDKANVTKFLVPTDDSWTRKMRFGDTHVHVIRDRKRYEELDKGGAIYHLSPDGFSLDQTKVGGKNEWTSNTSVTPTEKEEYESGLEAQLDNGVQVYFVDEETFNRITQSEDHGVAIIKGLVSENKLKNINPKEIPQ